MEITFSHVDGFNDTFPPVPASHVIPEWYKNHESYLETKKKPTTTGTSATIKKCVPVFDVITAGYLVRLESDIYVDQVNGSPYFRWRDTHIEFHPPHQAVEHPDANGYPYPKFITNWVISMPKGYSALIINPVHRESPFRILEGLIDLDSYYNPVNFPFVLKDPHWEGLIPAGTPLGQIIPIKRESWKMAIKPVDIQRRIGIHKILKQHFFDSYRNHFWTRKEYK